MEIPTYEKFHEIEKKLEGLQQQITVLQDFTGLRETLETNLKRSFTEARKESLENENKRI